MFLRFCHLPRMEPVTRVLHGETDAERSRSAPRAVSPAHRPWGQRGQRLRGCLAQAHKLDGQTQSFPPAQEKHRPDGERDKCVWHVTPHRWDHPDCKIPKAGPAGALEWINLLRMGTAGPPASSQAKPGPKPNTEGMAAGWGRPAGGARTQPLHTSYTALTRPLHGRYTALTRPLHGRYTALTRPLHGRYAAAGPWGPGWRPVPWHRLALGMNSRQHFASWNMYIYLQTYTRIYINT